MTAKPSKEERARIREEWRAAEAKAATPSRPTRRFPQPAEDGDDDDAPMVLVNARGERRDASATATPSPRVKRLRPPPAPPPPLDLGADYDSALNQSAFSPASGGMTVADPHGAFVDAAIKAGWLKPR